MNAVAVVLTGLVALSHLGFLAAGLVWGLVAGRRDVLVFFLACVAVAGIFGGFTAKTTILFTQALPAVVALAFVCAARWPSSAS